MENTFKLKTMKPNYVLFAIALLMFACQKNDSDSTPSQTIVTSDSSNVTGRLYVDMYDGLGRLQSNATARLYLSYDDIKRNIPLYTFKSSTNGRVDFGYILEGNYYLTGTSSNGLLHDTTPAQVLPQRTLTRKLILR